MRQRLLCCSLWMIMNKKIILTAAFFGCLAVILGAFGSHGLEGKVSESQIETWETANRYHFYHTLAILFLSTFSRAKSQSIQISFISFTAGIFLFSGSLYLLSTRSLLGIDAAAQYLGPVTPLGGMLFIVGWVGLFVAALRHRA